MQHVEVLEKARQIVREAGEQDDISVNNFLDFSDMVRDVVMAWPKERLESTPWIKTFSLELRKLRDDFAAMVSADPMMLYKPAHQVALDFHKSTAFIRYYRGANRIAKTVSAQYDIYAVVTGQMIYRPAPPPPCAAFVIGVNFSQYGQTVFEKKYITGEQANPLSPCFPEGGKWLHHYDSRKHIIYVACPECANKKAARECKHVRTIQLFSDEARDADVLAGGQYAIGHFDEEVSEKFYTEACMRLTTVPCSSLMVTQTPLGGKGRWEHETLTKRWEEGGIDNQIPGTNRKYVSLHTIDVFSAGLADRNIILAEMKGMAPAEIEARIWGRPAAFSSAGVFDAMTLGEMHSDVRPAQRGELHFKLTEEQRTKYGKIDELLAQTTPYEVEVKWRNNPDGYVYVWKRPQPSAQYVIGADVAFGLLSPKEGRRGDYSCAQVLKIQHQGLNFTFEQVAEWHGHINAHAYGDELLKLSRYYNNAVVVVERRGPGDATLHRLVRELGYAQSTFLDISNPATATNTSDSVFGVDTNVSSKGVLVTLLQKAIKDPLTGKRSIVIHDSLTLEELGTFVQERTETGLSYRYRGEKSNYDDRVMAVTMAVYAAITQPEIYDYAKGARASREEKYENMAADLADIWRQIHAEQTRGKRGPRV